jgi:sigma-B regulation protein RsbU (phosphoserine phosphatase)
LGVAVLDEPSADCICFVLDLTGRKQTEEALQQSQERYRQLLAAVTTYTYQVQLRNGEPVVTEHSLGCLTATGYSPADYQADPLLWIRMVPPEDRALVTGHVQALLAGQPVPPIEHRILHRDGSVRWIRSTLVPHHAESGSLVRYDGLVEDITERKRIEDRFRLLLESMPDAMLVAGRDGKILLVNEQAEQMFGYRREELIGRSVEMLVPPSLRESHAEQRAGYSKSPHTRLMGHGPEVRAMRKDGSEFPAEISLRPLVTEQGMQVFSAIRDITERKQAERALRENAAQLLAAQRIQEHLLPTEPPAIAGLDIAGALYAAEFAAGDYFDYLPMPDGALGVVIGDVAGHGFGPALVMASTHAHLQSLSQLHGEVSPILAQVNSILLREIEEDRYVTLLLARLDPRSRSFTFANAGHPAGYVLDAAGQLKARLESGSLPLGISSDTQFHAHGPVALEPGDLLLLLTDGILEASAADGAQFGVGRTLDVVRRNLARPAAEIIRAIYDAVLEFSAGHKIVDDLTTVIVKVDSSSIP